MDMQFPTLSTERLTLRPFVPTDWQAVYSYTANPAVMTYIPEGTFSEAQAQIFVEQHSGAEAAAVAVVLSRNARLIGHIIFHPWFAPETYEIGWVLNPEFGQQAMQQKQHEHCSIMGLHHCRRTGLSPHANQKTLLHTV
jgi:RimJ/RimL family protein N-acetyltransferase